MSNEGTDASDNLRALTRIVDEFRVIEADLPMSYAAAFLYVAKHEATHGEPPSVTDISNNIGLVRQTISRICQALGDRRQGSRTVDEARTAGSRMALRLLEKSPDPVDLRVTRWGLSAKGKGLLARLTEHVK